MWITFEEFLLLCCWQSFQLIYILIEKWNKFFFPICLISEFCFLVFFGNGADFFRWDKVDTAVNASCLGVLRLNSSISCAASAGVKTGVLLPAEEPSADSLLWWSFIWCIYGITWVYFFFQSMLFHNYFCRKAHSRSFSHFPIKSLHFP